MGRADCRLERMKGRKMSKLAQRRASFSPCERWMKIRNVNCGKRKDDCWAAGVAVGSPGMGEGLDA